MEERAIGKMMDTYTMDTGKKDTPTCEVDKGTGTHRDIPRNVGVAMVDPTIGTPLWKTKRPSQRWRGILV